MGRQARACGTALVLMILGARPIVAHHSAAAYELTRSLTLEATVAEIIFTNPHVMLHFDAKAANGEVQHWAIETYNPSLMKRAGWTKTTLKAGDHVTITFHPAINGTTNGYIRNGDGKIVFNGRELNLNQTAASDGADPQ